MLLDALRRSALLTLSSALVLGVSIGGLALREPAAARTAPATTNAFRQFTTNGQWRSGTSTGVSAVGGTLTLSAPTHQRTFGARAYDEGWWTSPWTSASFTELNPSWNARTPGGSWIIVEAQVRAGSRTSTWQNLGRWSESFSAVTRTSRGPQTDALSRVSVDTLLARSGVRFSAYRLKVHLLRPHGTSTTPSVGSLHAVATLPGAVPPVSRPALPARTLAVPQLSQMIHHGEYPQYGGGGEAWCSPTSLAMILAYDHRLPAASSYSWVSSHYRDRFVDEVARRVFDPEYDGTGNWPFNTAYAATRLHNAMLTRLGSLRDAERFIANGIPLEVSIAFSRGQLTGAPISSTPGHLVVIVGFTSNGDVVVNDPAAPTDATVRRTYDRAQFEAAWQGRSHGVAYVMRTNAQHWPSGEL